MGIGPAAFGSGGGFAAPPSAEAPEAPEPLLAGATPPSGDPGTLDPPAAPLAPVGDAPDIAVGLLELCVPPPPSPPMLPVQETPAPTAPAETALAKSRSAQRVDRMASSLGCSKRAASNGAAPAAHSHSTATPGWGLTPWNVLVLGACGP
jgi:hypothetical protein